MKKICATLCGFLFAAVPTAYAADSLPSGPAPSIEQSTAVSNWSGFYGGIHGGGTAVDVGHYDRFGGGINLDHDVSGGVIGGQVGYNHQTGSFVFGIEASASVTNADGSAANPNTRSFELESVVDVRGRAGYALGETLVYATAGVSFADINVSQFVNSSDGDHTGYVVGLGAAWRPVKHLSMGAEYLFADYGNEVYGFGGAPDDVSFTTHTFRAVVNFHFPSN